MNRHLVTLPVGIAVLSLSIAAAPAFAGKHAKHVKPEKMTCGEFLVLDEAVQPGVIYWLHGKSGKIEAIEIDAYTYPVEYVVTECTKHKDATVWEKVNEWSGKHTRPATEDDS